MSFPGVYIVTVSVLLCLLAQAYGKTYIIILKFQFKIIEEEPYLVCACRVDESDVLKEVALKRETFQTFGYVHYFNVQGGPGDCSCKFCRIRAPGKIAGEFLVYHHNFTETYAAEHFYYKQIGEVPGENMQSYIVWLLNRNGVYPAGRRNRVYSWNKKRAAHCP